MRRFFHIANHCSLHTLLRTLSHNNFPRPLPGKSGRVVCIATNKRRRGHRSSSYYSLCSQQTDGSMSTSRFVMAVDESFVSSSDFGALSADLGQWSLIQAKSSWSVSMFTRLHWKAPKAQNTYEMNMKHRYQQMSCRRVRAVGLVACAQL